MVKNEKPELDSVYILKIILYLILGSQWVRVQYKTNIEFALPIGALIGLLFVSHDHFQIDKKIEYAVLIVAMFVGFWLPMGLEITIN